MNDLPIQQEAIFRLADEMMKRPQVELPTFHYFADGMYGRVCHFKKDEMAVGKVQKKEHFFIVTKGTMMVGKERCEAGTVIVGKAGANRAVYALEDSICMTVHRTKKRNIDKIEKQLIESESTRMSLFDSSNRLKVKVLK